MSSRRGNYDLPPGPEHHDADNGRIVFRRRFYRYSKGGQFEHCLMGLCSLMCSECCGSGGFCPARRGDQRGRFLMATMSLVNWSPTCSSRIRNDPVAAMACIWAAWFRDLSRINLDQEVRAAIAALMVRNDAPAGQWSRTQMAFEEFGMSLDLTLFTAIFIPRVTFLGLEFEDLIWCWRLPRVMNCLRTSLG